VVGEPQLLQTARHACSTSCLVFKRCFPASPCISAAAMLLLLSQGMEGRKLKGFLGDQNPGEVTSSSIPTLFPAPQDAPAPPAQGSAAEVDHVLSSTAAVLEGQDPGAQRSRIHLASAAGVPRAPASVFTAGGRSRA